MVHAIIFVDILAFAIRFNVFLHFFNKKKTEARIIDMLNLEKCQTIGPKSIFVADSKDHEKHCLQNRLITKCASSSGNIGGDEGVKGKRANVM